MPGASEKFTSSRRLASVPWLRVARVLSMSMERYDLSLLRDEARQNIRSLYATTELPLNADFESG